MQCKNGPHQGDTSLGEEMAQVFCPTTKELSQFTDPGETKRYSKEPIENAEDPASRGFRSNVAIT